MKTEIWKSLRKSMSVALVAGAAASAGLGVSAAEASKLVALVIGSSTEASDVRPKIKALEENLFNYGGSEVAEARIFTGHNLNRDDLLARLSAFENAATDEGETLTILAYIGPVAHSEKGATYVVPAGWNGEDDHGLVALHNTLEILKSKGRNYVLLDALPMSDRVRWKASAVRPGLGKLAAYGAPERLAIAYAEVPISALSSSPLSEAFSKKLTLERIKFGDLPELVHEEALFESGKSAVPRKVGSVGGSLELVRLNASEMEKRKEKCVSARLEAANKVAASNFNTVTGDGQPEVRSARGAVQARSDFIEWFCPEPDRTSRNPKVTSPAPPRAQQQPQQQPKVIARTPESGNQGSGRGVYNSGSGATRSWAPSAVPLPN